MNSYEHFAKILGCSPDVLSNLDKEMSSRTGRRGVLDRMREEQEELMKHVLKMVRAKGSPCESRGALRDAMQKHETEIKKFLKKVEGENEFQRAAGLAQSIANVGKGFFLKKQYGEEILRKRTPHNLLAYLKLDSVDELLNKYDITEIFSALRFIESNEWMHETFDRAYSHFTANDFEERDIEVRALGPEWHEVAKKYLAKKRHNVSHLKEFGVIFLNPVKEESPGKFIRDFALLFHYLHEVDFYSKMFRKYASSGEFAEHFKSLLRGDILDQKTVAPGEWLIVQRYLFKEDPKDARLFIPHMNPESIHWGRGERDLIEFGAQNDDVGLELWRNLDWVGAWCEEHKDVVSFDLEDTAMALVAKSDGKDTIYNYHQKEALWTKMFIEYAGGEAEMEKLLIENFIKGSIQF